jgi:hypothetical protein
VLQSALQSWNNFVSCIDHQFVTRFGRPPADFFGNLAVEPPAAAVFPSSTSLDAEGALCLEAAMGMIFEVLG